MYFTAGRFRHHFLLARFTTPKTRLSLLFIATATMISQRPQRIRKPKVIWEAAEVPGDKIAKRTILKGLRTIKKEALIPILADPLRIL